MNADVLFGYFIYGIVFWSFVLGIAYWVGRSKGIFYVFWGVLAVGWIPILFNLSPNQFMTPGDGLLGVLGVLSLVFYTFASLVFIGLALFRPDPDGLPAVLGAVASVYPTPKGLRPVKSGGLADIGSLKEEIDRPMGSVLGEKIRARASKKQEARVKAKAEAQKAKEALARTAELYNKQKVWAEEAEKRANK